MGKQIGQKVPKKGKSQIMATTRGRLIDPEGPMREYGLGLNL